MRWLMLAAVLRDYRASERASSSVINGAAAIRKRRPIGEVHDE